MSQLLIYRWGLKRLGEQTYISSFAHLLNMRCIAIGENSTISRRTSLLAFTSYGETSYEPSLSIGSNVYVGKGCTIACCNEVTIEDGVTIGDNVYIADSMHGYSEIGTRIMEQALSVGHIRIGSNSWLGYACFIAHDVEIGEHAIIAANSVVKKSVPPYSVVAGSPARVIKRYDFDKREWIKASPDTDLIDDPT